MSRFLYLHMEGQWIAPDLRSRLMVTNHDQFDKMIIVNVVKVAVPDRVSTRDIL